MVSYQEALEIIIAAGKLNPLPPEHICVTKIPGRVSAADINAAIANPPFDNAARPYLIATLSAPRVGQPPF